ncbi:MAG: S26 family signal peptidase [Hyphomonadaceae bacterium]|jgi:type IV secretory pathway protease TraF|nr:S26 family signal peptidase [Hyphomonadaceae bacterium]
MNRFRRHRAAIAAAVAAMLMLATASFSSADLVLFNHSPSIPIGLYVRDRADLRPGVIVTVRARDVAPEIARLRDYDDPNDRFIKHVAAIGGQSVCADGRALSIDGVQAAVIYRASGQPMPAAWLGCRRLAADEVLLLGDSPDSFDGRYWGPINARFIEGVWRKL